MSIFILHCLTQQIVSSTVLWLRNISYVSRLHFLREHDLRAKSDSTLNCHTVQIIVTHLEFKFVKYKSGGVCTRNQSLISWLRNCLQLINIDCKKLRLLCVMKLYQSMYFCILHLCIRRLFCHLLIHFLQKFFGILILSLFILVLVIVIILI